MQKNNKPSFIHFVRCRNCLVNEMNINVNNWKYKNDSEVEIINEEKLPIIITFFNKYRESIDAKKTNKQPTEKIKDDESIEDDL